ncbi:hypothetical protein EDB89DRAFT_1555910 [Lactarius sanguifluus]|nr:hypothetical protein EDB89DRAFT_1555910 [Lactarius sanguifluus]
MSTGRVVPVPSPLLAVRIPLGIPRAHIGSKLLLFMIYMSCICDFGITDHHRSHAKQRCYCSRGEIVAWMWFCGDHSSNRQLHASTAESGHTRDTGWSTLKDLTRKGLRAMKCLSNCNYCKRDSHHSYSVRAATSSIKDLPVSMYASSMSSQSDHPHTLQSDYPLSSLCPLQHVCWTSQPRTVAKIHVLLLRLKIKMYAPQSFPSDRVHE